MLVSSLRSSSVYLIFLSDPVRLYRHWEWSHRFLCQLEIVFFLPACMATQSVQYAYIASDVFLYPWKLSVFKKNITLFSMYSATDTFGQTVDL